MKKKKDLPECPVATTVQLVSGKWKLLVIQRLLDRPWRFNELVRSIDGVSQKVLTSTLREMQSDKIIRRRELSESPLRVEYSLTKLGESMRPIIKAMEDFGLLYKERRKLTAN